ncbi:MAG: hypothetical protein EXR79_02950 [Myxococcales bacterium]|nr:hypothetical protein [Myxococcales bacterium]
MATTRKDEAAHATWTRAAVGALALATCCTSEAGNFGTNQPAVLSVSVENQPWDFKATTKVAEFAPDQTRGQATYTKSVTIRNGGTSSGGIEAKFLCLKSVKWDSKNTLLKYTWKSAQPKDEAKCPAAQIALAPGKLVQAEVTYKPEAEKDDFGVATLIIEHSDLERPDSLASPVKVPFGIGQVGAKVCPDTTDYVFINATKANPPQACFTFRSCGTASLSFDSAKFDSANAQFDIIETPDKGATLAAEGEPDNPKTNPKKFKVCLRYTPDGDNQNDDIKLVVKTTDKGSPEVKVSLSAKMEFGKWELKCSSPSGELVYDFRGVLSGAKQGKCTVCNLGPAALSVQQESQLSVQAHVASHQQAAEEVYKAELQKIDFTTGKPVPFVPPIALGSDKCMDVVVTYTVPNTGVPPGAAVVLKVQQANQSDAITIPILVGDCTNPEPVIGWLPDLWQQAKLGDKVVAKVAVANQGCGHLWLQQLCTTPGKSAKDNVCIAAPGPHHGLVGAPQGVMIDPAGIKTFEVEFHPANDKLLTINELLHVVYCPGKFDGKVCQVPLAALTMNLIGSLKVDLAKPGWVPELLNPADKPAIGKKIVVTGKYTVGAYDGARYYRWAVFDRPKGSLAWIPTDGQTSNDPLVAFVPDKPGVYTIATAVQVLDEKVTSEFLWSKQATLDITVP